MERKPCKTHTIRVLHQYTIYRWDPLVQIVGHLGPTTSDVQQGLCNLCTVVFWFDNSFLVVSFYFGYVGPFKWEDLVSLMIDGRLSITQGFKGGLYAHTQREQSTVLFFSFFSFETLNGKHCFNFLLYWDSESLHQIEENIGSFINNNEQSLSSPCFLHSLMLIGSRTGISGFYSTGAFLWLHHSCNYTKSWFNSAELTWTWWWPSCSMIPRFKTIKDTWLSLFHSETKLWLLWFQVMIL